MTVHPDRYAGEGPHAEDKEIRSAGPGPQLGLVKGVAERAVSRATGGPVLLLWEEAAEGVAAALGGAGLGGQEAQGLLRGRDGHVHLKKGRAQAGCRVQRG